mgnify:CR=1 FL=1
MRRFAVCLLGMGAPSGPKDVRAYLYRIFGDRHIIPLPAALRIPLAWWIAMRRYRASRASSRPTPVTPRTGTPSR